MKIKLKEIEEFDIEIVVLKTLKECKKEDKELLKQSGFNANEGEVLFHGKKLYVGTKKLKGEDIKIAFSNAIKAILKTKYTNIKISLVNKDKGLNLKDIVEGLVLGSYSFNKYKSKKEEKELNVFIDNKDSKHKKTDLQNELNETVAICESVNLVRNIVNTAPEDFTPITMAEKAKEISFANGLECKIQGEEYLEKHGMNAMLAVGRASRHESQLIHLTYKPKNPKGKIVLVGKGLTYDCGGLSLKSSEGMVSMKCDKSGASAVLGVMNSLNAISCEYEVHGILGAVENMIGGDAYKPDDVLVARNGKTIEVRNTDAEGRLVLADCLCYAQDEIKDIDYIFDLATLTGACIIALGEYTTGVMGHNKKLKTKINKASDKSGELVGFLPFNRYLPPMIKSNVADIVNSVGSKAGGAITAALFLDNFIKDENKNKWLHFDIAGAAYREKVWGYNPYGASGAGVRLLLEFIQNQK
ncbi:MAG: leucyl aminopeptidase [Arcobacter sp.]|uniref:leucyl aminopeptidase n=1 Tax=Arcobacter sp. TaxID=1872629 RepID=UPI003C764219